MRYTTSFSLEYDLYKKIWELAHKKKITVSELIRRALVRYVNEEEGADNA